MVRNMLSFYSEALLAPLPTPKLENHPLSAVLNCLFNKFAAAIHTGGRSTTRYLGARRAIVTYHLSVLSLITDSSSGQNYKVDWIRCKKSKNSVTEHWLLKGLMLSSSSRSSWLLRYIYIYICQSQLLIAVAKQHNKNSRPTHYCTHNNVFAKMLDKIYTHLKLYFGFLHILRRIIHIKV